jgi:hypothetical protein
MSDGKYATAENLSMVQKYFLVNFHPVLMLSDILKE